MASANPSRDVEEKIVSSEALAAQRLLLDAMPGLGLTPSSNSGHVKAVRLHDSYNRYVFSWVPAKGHLLFYVRKPALTVSPELAVSIQSTALPISRNPAGEITIRIENSAAARLLLDWLVSEVSFVKKQTIQLPLTETDNGQGQPAEAEPPEGDQTWEELPSPQTPQSTAFATFWRNLKSLLARFWGR